PSFTTYSTVFAAGAVAADLISLATVSFCSVPGMFRTSPIFTLLGFSASLGLALRNASRLAGEFFPIVLPMILLSVSPASTVYVLVFAVGVALLFIGSCGAITRGSV